MQNTQKSKQLTGKALFRRLFSDYSYLVSFILV